MKVELMNSDACQFCDECHGSMMSPELGNIYEYCCNLDNRLNKVIHIQGNRCPNFKPVISRR